MKKRLLIFIFLIVVILNVNLVNSQCICGVDQTTGNCLPCSSDQAKDLTSDQLSQPGTLQQVSDLNQLNPDALSQAMNKLYGTSDFNLNGQSATVSGSTLTVSGTTIDLAEMKGKSITASGNDVFVDGKKMDGAQNVGTSGNAITADSVKYFESGTTTFINGEGVSFGPNDFTLQRADSVSYEGSTSTRVVDFTAESGTFRVNSADLVIVETMTFNRIKNSTFVLQNGKLLSASVVSNQINNAVKIPNLIPQSSQYINVNYNLNSGFGINYRTDPNKIEFRADENVSLWLLNEWNISFVSYSNNSYFAIIKDVPPMYRIKNGILNYSTNETVEQLESTCGLTDVNIDFRIGFAKLVLSPTNVTVLCAGSRYNLIDKFIREKSYSIYNVGDQNYYLGFEKGISVGDFGAFVTRLLTKDNGFINKENSNIELNGVIEYDRTPEKDLFPGLNYSEYLGEPISWKEVVLSNAEDISTNIAALNERIDITARTNGTTPQENTTVFEVNSGFFNIREIQKDTMRRYGSFNKKIIYPDYIEAFNFNDEPTITIEDKKLTETEPDGRVIEMFTPGTQESNSFLDWLKIKMAIKDIYEWMKRMAGR